MKKFRKLLCLSMAVVTALSMSVTASAEIDNDSGILLNETIANAEPDAEGYVLVSEETFVNEDGVTVTHRSYIKDNGDGISPCGRDTQGVLETKETETYKVGITPWVTLWVEGRFTWNSISNTSTVVLLDEGYIHHATGVKIIKNEPAVCKNNQGGSWGGSKYSCIDKRITMKGGTTVGMSSDEHEFRLWVDVDVKGNKHLTCNDPTVN